MELVLVSLEIYDLVAKETNDYAVFCLDSTVKVLEVERSYST
jgi:hypothetical protein